MEEMDEDEDKKIMVKDVPFIAADDFLLKYGKDFELSFNEDRQVVLTALSAEAEPAKEEASSCELGSH